MSKNRTNKTALAVEAAVSAANAGPFVHKQHPWSLERQATQIHMVPRKESNIREREGRGETEREREREKQNASCRAKPQIRRCLERAQAAKPRGWATTGLASHTECHFVLVPLTSIFWLHVIPARVREGNPELGKQRPIRILFGECHEAGCPAGLLRLFRERSTKHPAAHWHETSGKGWICSSAHARSPSVLVVMLPQGGIATWRKCASVRGAHLQHDTLACWQNVLA